MDGLWDWITSPFSSGSSGSSSTLTPDQQQMLTQQGWYPRPDMVLPTGSNQQQMFPTQGYGNLTPAQAATASPQTGLGYYTPGQDQGGDSLWNKVKAAMTGDAGKSAFGDIQNALQGPKPLSNLAPAAPLQKPAGLLNPYHNLYTPTVLDPKQALQRFQRGY